MLDLEPKSPALPQRLPETHGVSIDELVRAQGVVAATDLDAIGSLLPSDTDPDQLFSFVQTEREARKQLHRVG